MTMKTSIFPAAAAILILAASPSVLNAEARVGDPSVGARIALDGAGVTAPCKTCHGDAGGGTALDSFPRLAGFSEYYLRKQLRDFEAGSRKQATMQPLTYGADEQEIADLAAYYASLPTPPFPESPTVDPKVLAAGERLAEAGDPERQLVACANCHGPEGIGLPPAIPSLVGQTSGYITAQLTAWQRGDRKNDDGGLMAAVANALNEADIAAVAAYYATVRPARLEP